MPDNSLTLKGLEQDFNEQWKKFENKSKKAGKQIGKNLADGIKSEVTGVFDGIRLEDIDVGALNLPDIAKQLGGVSEQAISGVLDKLGGSIKQLFDGAEEDAKSFVNSFTKDCLDKAGVSLNGLADKGLKEGKKAADSVLGYLEKKAAGTKLEGPVNSLREKLDELMKDLPGDISEKISGSLTDALTKITGASNGLISDLFGAAAGGADDLLSKALELNKIFTGGLSNNAANWLPDTSVNEMLEKSMEKLAEWGEYVGISSEITSEAFGEMAETIKGTLGELIETGKIDFQSLSDAAISTFTNMGAALLEDGTIDEWLESAKGKLGEWGELIGLSAETTTQAFAGTFDQLKNNLSEFIETGKFNFDSLKDTALSALGEIAKSLAKTMLNNMSAGGGIWGSIAGGLASLFHTGGIVGQGSGSARSVSPLVFAGAEKFHSGGVVGGMLNPGEVPIIAQKGEMVLTRQQQTALGAGLNSGGANVNVQVINNTAAKVNVEQQYNGNGELSIRAQIDDAMAGIASSKGSKFNQSMKQSRLIRR